MGIYYLLYGRVKSFNNLIEQSQYLTGHNVCNYPFNISITWVNIIGILKLFTIHIPTQVLTDQNIFTHIVN